MLLPIPTPSQTGGPQYALDELSCFNKIDAHDHSNNKGAPIALSSLTVSQDLSMEGYGLTSLKYVQFSNQTTIQGAGSLYMLNNELYFKDGTNTYNVQITNNGSVNVSGQVGFVGLPSGTASATYIPALSTFKYESSTNVAATLDVGPLKLNNLAPTSKYVLVSSPVGLAANYNLTLPTSLPAATKIVQLSSTGTLTADLVVDNSTLEISSNILQVKDGGITSAKLSPSITFPAGSVDAAARLSAPYFITNSFTGTFGAGAALIQTQTLTTSANNKMIMVGLFGSGTQSYFSANGGTAYVYATIQGGSIGETTIGYLYTSGTEGSCWFAPYYITSGQATYTIRLRGTGTAGGWGFTSNWKFWASELG
jgi:hypothetical protein